MGLRVMTCGRRSWLVAVSVGVLAVATGCARTMEQRFAGNIRYLADDKREGRGIGSSGLKASAAYIEKEFRHAGLTPMGDGGTFRQTFPMTLDRELTDQGRLAIGSESSVGDGAAAKQLGQGRDYIPMSFSSNDVFHGELAFCGYAVTDEERKWDDFAHVDLTKKVALVLTGEPPSWADTDGFPTRHAMLRNKVYNVKDRGAVAVLFVHTTPAAGAVDSLPEFDGHTADDYGLPAFHVRREVADRALAQAGAAALESIEADLNAGKMVSKGLAGVFATGAAGFKREQSPTSNIVAALPGNGRLAEEWVVVGAHYDHLGIRKPMGRRFRAGKAVEEDPTPQIHNGADDNASGTSGLIEIARDLKGKIDELDKCVNARGVARRSVLFIAFSAEETGLHGSKHFVDHAPVPMEKVVAMLNMDMIGRLDPVTKELTVFGTGTAAEFPEMLTRLASHRDLKVASTEDPGGRSDHAAFVAKQVPSLHFYTGSHKDYHQPGDDTEKINVAGGAEVTRLVHDLTWNLATSEPRPAYKQVKAPEQRGVSGFRVVMGLTPNYTDTSRPGMGVDAVSAEGPAEMGGMKAGDRVVRINGKKVENVYDYMASTRGNKAGDVVEVVVLRGEEELTLKVTLAGAR